MDDNVRKAFVASVLEQVYDYSYGTETIEHHGIKGQKWGVRRFQNEDGTLTEAGKKKQKSNKKTVGQLKAEHRSHIESINKNYTGKKRLKHLQKENKEYQKKLDEANHVTSKSEKAKKVAKAVMIGCGIAVAAYLGYKFAKGVKAGITGDYSKDDIDNMLKNIHVEEDASDLMIKEAIEKYNLLDKCRNPTESFAGKGDEYIKHFGLESKLAPKPINQITGNAKVFKDSVFQDVYNRNVLFDANKYNMLDGKEKDAIRAYTGAKYVAMNQSLRTGHMKDEETKSLIENVTSALNKSTLLENTIVHRGISFDGAKQLLKVNSLHDLNMDNIKEKSPLEKGFSSAGGHVDDAWDKDVTMHIFCPKGTHAMYVDPISKFPGEHEMLLQRGTQYNITNARFDENGNLRDIYCTVIKQLVDD